MPGSLLPWKVVIRPLKSVTPMAPWMIKGAKADKGRSSTTGLETNSAPINQPKQGTIKTSTLKVCQNQAPCWYPFYKAVQGGTRSQKGSMFLTTPVCCWLNVSMKENTARWPVSNQFSYLCCRFRTCTIKEPATTKAACWHKRTGSKHEL